MGRTRSKVAEAILLDAGSPLRLACITHSLRGGAPKSLTILLQHLPKLFESWVFTASYEEPNGFQKAGITTSPLKSRPLPLRLHGVPTPTLGTYLRWARGLVYFHEAVRQIRRVNPEIVILNGLTNLHYAPFFKDTAIVLFAREIACTSFPEHAVITLFINRHVNHVVAITEHERDALHDVHPPITVLYNPNDREIAVVPHKDRHSDGIVRVGVLGQICEPKGQFLVLEAIRHYKQRFEEAGVRFLLFGNDLPGVRKNLAELTRLTQRLDCEHLVAFPGWMNDIDEVLKGLDIVLRPELTGSPWGRDIIESMSHGLPVIASGQNEVFVKHGETGRLFKTGDIHAMTQHIVELAVSRQMRERYGARALQFAREHFSPSLYAQRVASILDVVATN